MSDNKRDVLTKIFIIGWNEMKAYEQPKLSVIILLINDIITESGDDNIEGVLESWDY